ncbi:MAG: hypothetical protein QW118_04070 [Nitrososphaerota archaeon]
MTFINLLLVMVEARYIVKVMSSEKSICVSREIVEQLKNSLGSKMIQRMKKEYVECPVANKRVSFLECYSCTSFIRRIRGEVHCAGIEFKLKT